MELKLVVHTGDFNTMTFGPITHSWMDGKFLFFHTKGSGPDNPCGINMSEVLGWEFVAEKPVLVECVGG